MNSLVLSAHDFRTARKASIHFIAAELARRGPTRFFSLRYSWLSARKGDSRLFLDGRANRIETVEGVDCFLWKELLHPFNMRRHWFSFLETVLFRLSQRWVPETMVRWIREADVIIVESGNALAYVAMAHALNPAARLIYRGSDDLDTIQSAAFVKREFAVVADLFHAICLLSPKLATGIPTTNNVYWVPNGIDPSIADRADPTPYGPGLHAVSVGSMLFDPEFFFLAAPAFPEITFHVIGPGVKKTSFPSNVEVYGEMSFGETLRFIKHARIGIAPYRHSPGTGYLADSSLKLLQYRFFGIASVCPHSVTGGAADRHGYTPGQQDSIVRAIRAALLPPQPVVLQTRSWGDTVDRLLDPGSFFDTRVALQTQM